MKTRTPKQSIFDRDAQWTQPWPRVQSQVDVLYCTRHKNHENVVLKSGNKHLKVTVYIVTNVILTLKKVTITVTKLHRMKVTSNKLLFQSNCPNSDLR